MTWKNWSEWNDEYTRLLRKRNTIEREELKRRRAGTFTREWEARWKVRLSKADKAVRDHVSDPSRPSSSVTFAFGSGDRAKRI